MQTPSQDWWPHQLSHIQSYDPWEATQVVIAEVRSFEEKPHPGRRIASSALVPIEELDLVLKNLRGLSHEVSTSGPHPTVRDGSSYTPEFRIDAYDLPRTQYEPFALSWASGDKTTLQIAPGFLMTYGLAPRVGKDGGTTWDDPAKPAHSIAFVSAPSTWKFPTCSPAYISVDRAYLQDYLSLRKMALVQTYWEMRWGDTDQEIEQRLGEEQVTELRYTDRLIQLNRYLENRNVIAAQAWGARVVARPANFPISSDPFEKQGLVWPGYERPITNSIAARLRTWDFAYFDDKVLEAYEGKKEFQVFPSLGSVSFGSQWSVGFSERIGRNVIRLELKKLYEGAPPKVISHWHKFAIGTPSFAELKTLRGQKNIADRAKSIAYALVRIGELLSDLAFQAKNVHVRPSEFVKLDRQTLDYSGWWSPPEVEEISRQVPIDCSEDFLLDRFVGLTKLLVENLSEMGCCRFSRHQPKLPEPVRTRPG